MCSWYKATHQEQHQPASFKQLKVLDGFSNLGSPGPWQDEMISGVDQTVDQFLKGRVSKVIGYPETLESGFLIVAPRTTSDTRLHNLLIRTPQGMPTSIAINPWCSTQKRIEFQQARWMEFGNSNPSNMKIKSNSNDGLNMLQTIEVPLDQLAMWQDRKDEQCLLQCDCKRWSFPKHSWSLPNMSGTWVVT